MKTYLFIGIVLFALVLQVSFLPALRPFGVVPDLLLIVIAAAALTGPLVLAMVTALSGGFVLDLVSGSDFGLRTGLLAITVLICAYVGKSGLQIGFRPQLLIVVLATTSLTALISILQIVFSGGRVELSTVLSGWLIVLALNCIIGLSIGPMCARLARSDELYGGNNEI